VKLVSKFCDSNSLNDLGQNGQDFLVNNFDVAYSVSILEHIVEPVKSLNDSDNNGGLDSSI